jgi:hypothetical protein
MLSNLPADKPKKMHMLGCVLSPRWLDVCEDATVHPNLGGMDAFACGADSNPFSLGDHLVDSMSFLKPVQVRIDRFQLPHIDSSSVVVGVRSPQRCGSFRVSRVEKLELAADNLLILFWRHLDANQERNP